MKCKLCGSTFDNRGGRVVQCLHDGPDGYHWVLTVAGTTVHRCPAERPGPGTRERKPLGNRPQIRRGRRTDA
jgi:hypothetical protein